MDFVFSESNSSLNSSKSAREEPLIHSDKLSILEFLQRENESLRIQLSQKQELNSEVCRKFSQLQASTESEIEQVLKHLASVESQQAYKSETISRLDASNKRKQAKLDLLNAEIEELASEKLKLAQANHDLREEVENVRCKFETTVSELHAAHARELEEKTLMISAQAEKLNSYLSRIAHLESTIRTMERETSKQLDDKDKTIAKLSGDLESAQLGSRDLKQELAVCTDKLITTIQEVKLVQADAIKTNTALKEKLQSQLELTERQSLELKHKQSLLTSTPRRDLKTKENVSVQVDSAETIKIDYFKQKLSESTAQLKMQQEAISRLENESRVSNLATVHIKAGEESSVDIASLKRNLAILQAKELSLSRQLLERDETIRRLENMASPPTPRILRLPADKAPPTIRTSRKEPNKNNETISRLDLHISQLENAFDKQVHEPLLKQVEQAMDHDQSMLDLKTALDKRIIEFVS